MISQEDRTRKRARHNPWERDPKEIYTPQELHYIYNYSSKRPKFYAVNGENMYLDIYTKRAVLKASASVVSLVSYSGEEEIFQGSGTIIESDDAGSIILTSATLIRCPMGKNAVANNIKVVVYLSSGQSYEGQILAHDFHYNISSIKIQSDSPLPTACLRRVDDSISIDPSELYIPEEKSFQLHLHSNSINLIPGDTTIALGRYFIEPYDLMAAPGEFSLNRCENDCKELFRANCQITRFGIGGPIINRYGEVIGMSFYDLSFTPFLPSNVVSKWWEHYKKYGELRRPWLGMEVTNLYAADLPILEKVIQKVPNIFKGVIVEEVIPGSSADSAGICPKDFIVQCGGKTVQSFLELFEIMWDKVGEPVELAVIRPGDGGARLHLTMVVEEATPDKFYCWRLWGYAR